MDSSRETTLPDLVAHRARDRADDVAYIGLPDRADDEACELSYGELFQRSSALAALLRERNLSGTAGLLVYAPGLDFVVAFYACLLANVIAVPTYPPRPRGSLTRFDAMLRDSGARVILGDSTNLSRLSKRKDFCPGEVLVLETDSILANPPESWRRPEVAPEDLAFLQYTSGSTGGLKAVALSHRTIMEHSALIREAFGHSEESRGVICLPPYHDMGLIGGIIQPLFVGFPVVLLSPLAMMQRPLRWLQAISHYGATTSGGPDFFYELCVQRIAPEERRDLDLSRWTVAFNGSEMVKPQTLREFSAAYSHCGFQSRSFFPCYGMAEATLMISGCRLDRDPVVRTFSRSELSQGRAVRREDVSAKTHVADETDAGVELVSCGQAGPDSELAIVEPASRRRLGVGEVGEVWLKRGTSMPSGYWRRPEKTRRTFQAHLADTGDGPYLATRDQGFLLDGELYLVGRRDDLLIIRGRNYHCKDLETSVERSHTSFQATTVFDAGENGTPFLVVAQELRRPFGALDFAELRARIRQTITAEHGLRVDDILLVRPASIPRTANGKIQRFACREAYLAGKLAELVKPASTPRLEGAPKC